MCSRPRSVEIGHNKKRLQLVGAKARLSATRKDVEHICAAFSMSERHACGLLGIAVSSCRYRSRTQERERVLRTRLVELAHENPSYGSPCLYVLLRRETRCNHKRVERIYREARLSLRRKKRKRLVRQRVP